MRVLLIFMVLLAGCSMSTQNMPKHDVLMGAKERKVGYHVESIADELYKIAYTTPTLTAFDPFDDAWGMLDKKAEGLCGVKTFTLSQRHERKWTDYRPGWLKTVSAMVDCSGIAQKKFSAQQISQKKNEREKYKKLASEHSCLNGNELNLDMSVYQYAMGLYKSGVYPAAMQCFLAALDSDPENTEAYRYIGMMYEFGYGVEVDIEKAKEWYKKSELAW